MCVNTRIDAEFEEKISYILEKVGITQSDMVKTAIELLYEKVREEHNPSVLVRRAIGFVGGRKGEEHVSEIWCYKVL